jgi:fructan beta-fructosidase
MRPFFACEKATSKTEYAVILAAVVVALTAGLYALGRNVQTSSQAAAAGAGSSVPAAATVSTSSPATVSTIQTPSTVFSDMFSDADVTTGKWDFNGSWWQVKDQALHAGPVSGWNELRAYAIGSNFADGTISFSASITSGWGFGAFFHVSGDVVKSAFNGYSFQYDPGYGSGAFTLYKWTNGSAIFPPLAVAYPSPGYNWFGPDRHIEVTTQGSLITAKVDGATVLTATDGSYTSGGAGLRLWNDPTAKFSKFTVTTP